MSAIRLAVGRRRRLWTKFVYANEFGGAKNTTRISCAHLVLLQQTAKSISHCSAHYSNHPCQFVAKANATSEQQLAPSRRGTHDDDDLLSTSPTWLTKPDDCWGKSVTDEMGKSKFQISRSLDEKIRRIISGPCEPESEFALVSSAYILGFNYGNLTNCVGLTTNYQLHHAVFPVVGLAFFKEPPSDDEVKQNLKAIKEYSSSPNGLGSFKSDRNEHLFLIYSVDQKRQVDKRIFNFSKGSFVRRKSHRLDILNDPFRPRNIYNGTEDMFNLNDGGSTSSADEDQVDHLIFFIHGVGGVCDTRFRSCVEVVADFKKMANTLLVQHSNPSSGLSTPTTNKHLAASLKKGFFRKQSQESKNSQTSEGSNDTTESSSPAPKTRSKRVECLPISWHSLTRRQTGFSEQLSHVALSSVPKLRHFLNKVVMDAMLYSSGPVYTQTIINNVGNEINRLYTLFMERHPNFSGSISLAGHSLGSVIVFDLLAHQIPDYYASTTADSQQQQQQAAATNNNNNESYDHDNSNDNSNSSLKQDGKSQRMAMNTRRACHHIGHDHHHHHDNILAEDEHRHCSEYKNLAELLKDMDLTKHADLFQREHIDLESLLLLTDFDLKELQLPLGARRKLGTYINAKRVLTANYTPGTPMDGANSLHGNMNTGQYMITYPQLKFKPRCFFSFGSPTAMFLNVRGIQLLGENYKLPTCDRMLNIFHPYDPLAYRFEPLIDPRFKAVEPVLIPHHRGGKRMHVQLREGFARVGHDLKHRFFGTIRDTWSSFTGLGTANETTTTTTTTPELSRSSSIVDEVEVHVMQAKAKRQKLTKSVSADRSSTEAERESFETCASQFNSSQSSGVSSGRNPLRRQSQIRRSQSEAINSSISNGGGGGGGGGPSSLSSIIENSVAEPGEDVDQTDPNSSAVLEKLKMFKLDAKTNINVSCSVDDDDDDAGGGRVESPSGEPEVNGRKSRAQSTAATEAAEFDQTIIGKLNGGRRIDYVLQEKPIELFNEYIFAFTSHANYWLNEDSALIILNEIYQADGDNISDQLDG